MQVILTTATTPSTDTVTRTPTTQNHLFLITLSLYGCLLKHISRFLLISSPPYILCVDYYGRCIFLLVQNQLYRPCVVCLGFLPLESCLVLYPDARISFIKLPEYALPSKLPALKPILATIFSYIAQIHLQDLVPEDP